MAKIKLKPQFKRSVYREFCFICPSLHVTKLWCWNDISAIRCSTCNEWARRSDYFEKITSEITAYYKDKNGRLFIPGASDSRRIPKGYERVEIKNFRDRDRFYKETNLNDQMEHEQNSETEEIVFGEMRRQERSDLFHEMKGMSESGREFARRAIQRTNERRERYESRGYLVGLEYDKGNR